MPPESSRSCAGAPWSAHSRLPNRLLTGWSYGADRRQAWQSQSADAMAPERITGVLMRSLRPQLAAPLAGCAGLAACLTVVACSSPAAEVQLPARPTATPSIAASSSVLTPRQQVVCSADRLYDCAWRRRQIEEQTCGPRTAAALSRCEPDRRPRSRNQCHLGQGRALLRRRCTAHLERAYQRTACLRPRLRRHQRHGPQQLHHRPDRAWLGWSWLTTMSSPAWIWFTGTGWSHFSSSRMCHARNEAPCPAAPQPARDPRSGNARAW